ncbi:uncharacterized protein LOC105840401 isoform X1 [Monomorium pharaonis]|uniref:uncharacterized protein LOC105840401 isoform X1 n=2 Tax=Monomorium pharaonis TaxID=307658 RepID=UPI0017473489|nr:uncharacterized protein LOC105840401 isoform X1 [Monomorium pharaonis]
MSTRTIIKYIHYFLLLQTRNKLENRIRTSMKDQRAEQMILSRLQQIVEKTHEENRNSNNSGNKRQSSSGRNAVFFDTNIHNEDIARNDYTCYRCKHFLEITYNLSKTFGNEASSFPCKNELNFVQAIVWLKASIVTTSQISIEQLQQLFNILSVTRNEHRREDERTDIEQLRSPDEELRNERTSPGGTKYSIAASISSNISSVVTSTPQRKLNCSYDRSEDVLNKFVNSISMNDANESAVESNSILEGSSNNAARRKEKASYIRYPETDVESNISQNLECAINTSYSILEHQSFDYENDMECLTQSTSSAGIKYINEEIIKSKSILKKSHADISSKTILPAKNQSIDLFNSKHNFNGECITSMRSQNNFIDVVSESNSSPKNFIITPRNISQSTSILGDEFLLNDSPWQASNYTATGNLIEDSAYSTLHLIDRLNCNTTVKAGSIADKLDTEHYELQPYKKKTTTDEKQEIFRLANETLPSNGSSKSFIITQENILQMSHVHNDEHSKFKIINYDSQITDVSEISENDVSMTMEFMNSEDDAYEEAELITTLQSPKEKTVTREETTAWNLSKTENVNGYEMVSTDLLYSTLKSLHIDRVILASIRVIVLTLCHRRTAEEYLAKERQKNTRNHWKGSLEEQAVNAVLNISDILTTERKPNVCLKIIMREVIKTLNEMTTQKQSYKIHFSQVYYILRFLYL